MNIRQYFNLTNKCNSDCPFCCMWSHPSKNTFLDFNIFKNIIDSKSDPFELQLEGGEPLLHPNFYLFLEYAYFTKRCTKIVISTNGILLNDNLQRLTDFLANTNIPITLKPSINYHLIENDPKLIKKCRDLYTATEFIDNFKVIFNVRIRKDDHWIVDELEKNKIKEQSNIFEFQKYGRFENEEQYVEPFIKQNIDDWFIYACDGTCFDKDLIARSIYEKILR